MRIVEEGEAYHEATEQQQFGGFKNSIKLYYRKVDVGAKCFGSITLVDF